MAMAVTELWTGSVIFRGGSLIPIVHFHCGECQPQSGSSKQMRHHSSVIVLSPSPQIEVHDFHIHMKDKFKNLLDEFVTNPDKHLVSSS